ncbi:MAG: hypothetical protein KIT84_19590 [Labilithrix sp.]|nr:hypothetical protein [Labilithrix sp.]MCW5813240.1 hypothetical protein [Labilithrix sp.]
MNQDPKRQQQWTPQDGVNEKNEKNEKDGAGVRFVPSEAPSKLEPTPEKAREQENARH